MSQSPIHLVCPACRSVNRVPQDRLGEAPVCGRCRHSLDTRSPVVLDDDNFATVIERTSLPVVVDFWATWCPPCRMMAPAFEKAAGELWQEAILAKLDTDEAAAAAAPFRIQGIPCLIVFRGGREVARQSGAQAAPEIVRWVRSVIASGGQ